MKTLDRKQIDQLVGELEADVYGLALARANDPELAKALVLHAFGDVARHFPTTTADDLRRKLYARIKTAHDSDQEAEVAVSPQPVPADLHQQVVDVVEERQSDESVGRKKIFLGFAGGAAVLAAVGLYAYMHWTALAAATPTIRQTDPGENATAAPVDGAFYVNFGRPPTSKPVLTLEPKDGHIDEQNWSSGALVAPYHGLEPATRYTVTVQADYRSGLKDVGHYTHQWSFTTEGYPTVTDLVPADGQLIAFRHGDLQITFGRRPSLEPKVTLTPPSGTMAPGQWNGSTWSIAYQGLAPLSWYEATVSLDYGPGKPKVNRTWRFQTEAGRPPTGVPVIWYGTTAIGDPAFLRRLMAIDWNGNLVGTAYVPGYLRQSPGGSLLASGGTVLDAGGNVMAQLDGYYDLAFAADDRSLCAVGPPGGNAMTLLVGPPQGPFRKILTLPWTFNAMVAACSVLHDRAVLVHHSPMGGQALEVEVVRLSSGQVVMQRSYSPDSSSIVSASPDGAFLVETTAAPNAVDQGAPTWVTTIRRTSDGGVVTRLVNQRVLTFSWDGGRILTGPQVPMKNHNEFDLIDLPSGRVLWRLPGAAGTDGSEPAFAMPQPNGDDMLLAIATKPSTSDLDQLWRISKDGSAEQLLSQVFYPLGY